MNQLTTAMRAAVILASILLPIITSLILGSVAHGESDVIGSIILLGSSIIIGVPLIAIMGILVSVLIPKRLYSTYWSLTGYVVMSVGFCVYLLVAAIG